MTTYRDNLVQEINEVLLPNTDASRRKPLNKSLGRMTDVQLKSTKQAVEVAKGLSRRSTIREVIESGDLRTIELTARYGTMFDLSSLEAALNDCFNSGTDRMYDAYSGGFDAHIEAYATYHDHCGECTAYDADVDYDELPENYQVKFERHYYGYMQDFELMELVEKYPERVRDVVRFVTSRRNIDPVAVKEYLDTDSLSLSEGVL